MFPKSRSQRASVARELRTPGGPRGRHRPRGRPYVIGALAARSNWPNRRQRAEPESHFERRSSLPFLYVFVLCLQCSVVVAVQKESPASREALPRPKEALGLPPTPGRGFSSQSRACGHERSTCRCLRIRSSEVLVPESLEDSGSPPHGVLGRRRGVEVFPVGLGRPCQRRTGPPSWPAMPFSQVRAWSTSSW